MLYPGIQRKAQKEIDDIIGHDRLPDFADRENLPYINALCKEVMRTYVVAPLGSLDLHFPLYYRLTRLTIGVPHLAAQDDIHDGYYIPKGSLVIANIWYVNVICTTKHVNQSALQENAARSSYLF